MGRVTETDLKAALGFVASAPTGTRRDPIPAATLIGLRDLLHADEAEYFELRRADRAVLGSSVSDATSTAPGSEAALLVYGHQNPLNWRRWAPAHGALRMSERIRRRDFERTGFHDGYLRPNGLRDLLKVWLTSGPTSVACVQLWRYRDDFTRRDQDLLSVLQHHLVAMRRRSLRGGLPATASIGLTVREAEILTWVARGESDAAIARRLGIAPATVNKHLEHAYAALGVHSRAELVGRILAPNGGD